MIEDKKTKEKREDIRVPLLSEKVCYMVGGEYILDAELMDISNNGCFIYTKNLPRPNQHIQVHFKLPGDLNTLIYDGYITRVRWTPLKKSNGKPNEKSVGIGVNFRGKNEENKESIFHALVVYMRNKQIVTVSKRIIEEFFGGSRK